MELQINEMVAEAEMDLSKFRGTFKKSLELYKSIKASTIIKINQIGLNKEKIMLTIYGETNWLFFLNNLKTTDKKKPSLKSLC